MSRISTAVTSALSPVATQYDSREGREQHTVCLIQPVYIRHEGKISLPVSGPIGTPAKVIELHAPWGMKLLQWVVARNSMLPEIPDMDALVDAKNEMLAGWQISPVAPGIQIDGVSYEFGCSGVFAYWLRLPPDKKTGLSLHRRHFDKGAVQVLREANFSGHHRG